MQYIFFLPTTSPLHNFFPELLAQQNYIHFSGDRKHYPLESYHSHYRHIAHTLLTERHRHNHTVPSNASFFEPLKNAYYKLLSLERVWVLPYDWKHCAISRQHEENYLLQN